MIKVVEKPWIEFGEECATYYTIEKDGDAISVCWTEDDVVEWLDNNVLPDEYVEWEV